MADGTIDENTFTLARRDEAGNFGSIGGEVRYNLASKTATFDPTEKPLPLGSYRATITTGVQNNAGIAMAADYVWTFQITEGGGGGEEEEEGGGEEEEGGGGEEPAAAEQAAAEQPGPQQPGPEEIERR